MEANKVEAVKAKEMAEKRFAEKDFLGAKNYALKAKSLCPSLEGISQMAATFEVYAATRAKHTNAIDCYSLLGLNASADRDMVKKQYKKMAVLLHPDKNKTVGAEGAFKLVSEAWTWLSDSLKKSSYDFKRTKQVSTGVVHTSPHTSGVAGHNNCSNSSASHIRLDTFWTLCTSCKIQYEYLRKYVNKRLSCKNCRGTFIAVETGTAPVTGSFPYSPWSYVPSHGSDVVTYPPNTSAIYPGKGVSGIHSGHGYEYASNATYQWSSFSGTSPGAADTAYKVNGFVHAGAKAKSGTNGKRSIESSFSITDLRAPSGCNKPSRSKVDKPDKRRKHVEGATFRNGYEKKETKSGPEATFANGNGNANLVHDLSSPKEVKRFPVPPAFDARKMLIDKARTEIQKKLVKMKSASAVAKELPKAELKNGQSEGFKASPDRADSVAPGRQRETKKTTAVSITVPDPDFHDFDKDRSEECFRPKQIWALYDEDDGMPRLYCLIREVISVKPFKIYIAYLNSKRDTEFGSVNWLDSGFTKSCGGFRAWNSDVVEEVNIFSHVLSREKAGRGGCVRIYPRSGDIWAVYRNWSADWDQSTPYEVCHQYEMVVVLEDYSEELGIWVAPLVKLPGFMTVYQRNADPSAVRWIPRREMVRFSHQVPSCLLKEVANMPNECWDLDPAATPDDLLHAVEDAKA